MEFTTDMANESIPRLLLKLSPPVMLALLIQSVYNIADSFFIARYSSEGLTALSIVYPVQLLITALATGTGAGVNILISRMDGSGEKKQQQNVIISGFVLNMIHFIIFAVAGNALAGVYFGLSTDNAYVQTQGVMYMRIVFAGSFGLFVESVCTKILQARGNMIVPMIAQVTGSLVNIALDIVMIFGFAGCPSLGIKGAAVATVIGQWVAMVITLTAVLKKYSVRGHLRKKTCREIYANGIGSIVTQSLCTLYIVGLNIMLKGFTEDAVTVLGIYYKIQSFFFIPLLVFQQVLLPVISYNYGAHNTSRNREVLKCAIVLLSVIMSAAMLIFIMFPKELIEIFSSEADILAIGEYALPVISLSFVFAGLTIVMTAYMQGLACVRASLFIIVLRQVILLVPLAWVLHFIGLKAVWWTFPVTEVAAGISSAAYLFVFHKNI
ncbi:MAG: MATE family efflux transporter [[Bacteroides] pectinophilus]|nr:MATE family efflux transporter [[Bacteroides] pectinophilus]